MLVLAITGRDDNHRHPAGGSQGTVLSWCQETKSFGLEWTGWRELPRGLLEVFHPPSSLLAEGNKVASGHY